MRSAAGRVNGATQVMDEDNLHVECIDDETKFGALKAEWNVLAARSRCPSIFLRHEWFDAAWQWRRSDSTLRILRVRNGAETVALCPFVLRPLRRYGMRLHALEFLTVPDTQSCDILVAPEYQAAVVDAVARRLYEMRRQWDVISLDYLPGGSASAAMLEMAAERYKLPHEATVAHENFFIDLKTTWQAFYATRSRRLKKANNLNANHLRRVVGRIDVEWCGRRELDGATADAMLQNIIDVSARSWKRKTGLSLDNPGPRAFIESIVRHARANGWLSLWMLSLDGKPVATEFQLVHAGQVHALRADYDEAFKELSPGSYLNWKLIEALFGEGMDRYWLGPGANAYKRHWTEAREPLRKITLYGTSMRARALALLELRLRKYARRFARNGKSAQAP